MVEYRLLDDGSWLVVRSRQRSEPSRERAADDVLGPMHDFIIGGIVGGAAGNLTYDVLKAWVRDLVGVGEVVDRPPATAAEVTRFLEEFMLDAGYGPVDVQELLRIGDDGWLVRAEGGGRLFEARLDPSGQVAHVRAVG
jgi:hypothetical protein